MLAFFRNDMEFSGNNGFTDLKDILGFDLTHDATHLILLVCSYIVASRAGRVMKAIHDAESRARFIGFSSGILQALGVRLLGRAGGHCR
jgi:urea transport system permease protein